MTNRKERTMATKEAPFIAPSQQLMTYNPQTAEEWTEYLAWQGQQPRGTNQTTQAWRIARGNA
jgi:hypothetical protein